MASRCIWITRKRNHAVDIPARARTHVKTATLFCLGLLIVMIVRNLTLLEAQFALK